LGRSWEKFEKFGISGAKAERRADGDISGGRGDKRRRRGKFKGRGKKGRDWM
jgi:hypothetical protein